MVTEQLRKLPLEALFETEFSALGVEFSQRLYGTEILQGAVVDDMFHGCSEEALWAEARAKGKNYISSEDVKERLTKHQADVSWGSFPYFRRTSGRYNGFILDYVVNSQSDRDQTPEEKVAGWHSIKKNWFELIFIGNESNPFLVALELYSQGPNKGINVAYDDDISARLVGDTDSVKFNRLGLRSLRGEPFEPKLVCDAVMEFMSGKVWYK